MDLFQGGDAWFWFWVAIVFIVGVGVAVWFYTIAGADRKPRVQKRGEETIEHFGDIQEDRAPVPVFLIITYVGIVIWAVFYVVWTGVLGTGQ